MHDLFFIFTVLRAAEKEPTQGGVRKPSRGGHAITHELLDWKILTLLILGIRRPSPWIPALSPEVNQVTLVTKFKGPKYLSMAFLGAHEH